MPTVCIKLFKKSRYKWRQRLLFWSSCLLTLRLIHCQVLHYSYWWPKQNDDHKNIVVILDYIFSEPNLLLFLYFLALQPFVMVFTPEPLTTSHQLFSVCSFTIFTICCIHHTRLLGLGMNVSEHVAYNLWVWLMAINKMADKVDRIIRKQQKSQRVGASQPSLTFVRSSVKANHHKHCIWVSNTWISPIDPLRNCDR